MDPDSYYPKNPPIGSAPIGGGGRKNDQHQQNNQKRIVVDSSREAALPNSTRRVAHQQQQRNSNKQRGNTHDDGGGGGGREQQQHHSSSHYKNQRPPQSKVHKSYEEGHHHSSRRSDRNYKEHTSSQHYKTREKDDRQHRRNKHSQVVDRYNKDDRHTRDDREHKSSSSSGYQTSSRRSSRNSNKEGRDNKTKHHYQLRDSFTSEGSISDHDNHHPKNDRYNKSSKSKSTSRNRKEKGDIPKDSDTHSKQQQLLRSSFTSGEESISEEEHSANDDNHHRHYRGGKEIKPVVVEVDMNYDDIVDGNGETLDDDAEDLHVRSESEDDDDTIEIEYHTEEDDDEGVQDADISEGEERHEEDDDEDDIGFDEEIEEANYTTTANKGSDVDNDSDFDELHHQEVVEGERRGCYAEEGRGREISSSPIHNKEDPVQQEQDVPKKKRYDDYHPVGSNSPELNLNRRQISNEDGLREMKMPFDAVATGDTTEGDGMMPTDIVLHHEQTQTKPSYDPPTKETEDMSAVRNNKALDPKFDDSTLYSRFDPPPSLSGPERATEQENQLAIVQEDLHGMTIIHSSGSIRGQDPPESGRGCDPKALSGTNDPPPSSASSPPRSSNKYRGGSSTSGGTKGSRSRTSGKSSRTPKDRINNKKEKKVQQPEIKGILKKKGAPIPITQFGKPLENDNDNNDSNDSESVGSDPDMIESKQSAPTTTLELSLSNNHEKDDDAKSLGTMKSGGLRAGKYATVNAMAAWKNDTETENDSDDYYSMKTEDFYSNNKESTNNDGATYITDYDNNTTNCDYKSAAIVDDETTLKSISTNTNDRFDRSKSHFMRTSDLGLTQDTIFAEQFLDDLNSKAEPHYHCPSLHPPPGVQFHIDENWVCLDDGKGSHSPIAPQAVDALVAMGYRAACDPMMWTPSSKTRKYMTEKGLRFDDIPIPGPLDEGEGSPGDSNTQTWSGKFPHKYHGHEQPAIRSQGIVNMSPEELVDLLMDSNRVSEYNKSSIGRVDEVVLSDGTDLDSCPFSGQRKKKLTGVVMQGAKIVDGTATFDSETDDEQSDVEEIIEETFDDHGGKSVRTIMTSSSKRERCQSKFVGVTKLVRTTNKPPLVRKVLEFFTLLHCRALTDDQGGDGYIIVGRGITPAADVDSDKKGVMHSEILLNVHIIRRLRTSKEKKSSREKGRKGSSSRSAKSVSTSGRKASKSDLANRCLMINVNHLKSPLVPNMLAKKVGLSAALNFIMDIRALTE